MEQIEVRTGRPEDISGAMSLIVELAKYEHAADKVTLTEERMQRDAFGDTPWFQFLVAADGEKIVGLSLFYPRYSTWKGKGMYLEDLIVTRSYRGRGIGKRLLLQTAKIALEQQCTGLYWQVLNWNNVAINFYEKWGAKFDDEWINCKLDHASMLQI